MHATGTLAQLAFADPLLADGALRGLQLSADLVPHFAHELLVDYKLYAFLAAAYRLSHAVRVEPRYLHYLPMLRGLLLLRIALPFLIVAVGSIPIATLVLDLVIKRLIGNCMLLLRSIILLPGSFFFIGEVQGKAMLGGGLLSKGVLLCACFFLVIDELAFRVDQSSLVGQPQFLKGRRHVIRLAVIFSRLILPALLLHSFRIPAVVKVAVISALALFFVLLLLAGLDLVLGVVGVDPIVVLYLRSIYIIGRSLLLYPGFFVGELSSGAC